MFNWLLNTVAKLMLLSLLITALIVTVRASPSESRLGPAPLGGALPSEFVEVDLPEKPIAALSAFEHQAGCPQLAPHPNAVNIGNIDFNPLSSNFSFWDSNGQQFPATRIVLPDINETQSQTRCLTRWKLATNSPAGITLTIVARQVARGILALQITPSQPEEVRAIQFCLPAVAGEQFYGLGERFGSFNLAGHVLENWTADQAGQQLTYAPTPFLLSSQGYGLLLNTSTHATFDLQTETRGCYSVQVKTTQLQFYLIAGPHPQTVLQRHAQLVGLPPLPPSWAFGVWINLIGGQARVEQDVQRLLQADLPVDAVWIYDAVDDRAGFGWPWQIYGPVAPGSYPDLSGLIQRLHDLDLKVLGYLGPFLYPGTDSFAVAQQQGFLVQTPDNQPYVEAWTFAPRSYLDFTNPEASAWWQQRVRFALTDLGFDGAMLDFGEDAPVNGRYANGQSGRLMHNLYPVLYHQAAHQAGQAAKPDDIVFFARAGYSGSQPYTTGRFTGDQVRNWDRQQGLPSVIPAMLNGGLSGWPYWGPDIAGFFDAGWAAKNETTLEEETRIQAEKELWSRWVQLGALSPTMRDMRGAFQEPVELWTDRETQAIFRTYAHLHTALKPYLYRYAQIAHRRGLPIVRPLFLNYPAETVTYTLTDQYLLGDDILVAPVLQPEQTERQLYLPTGQWRDYWTDQVYKGPGWVTVAAPIERIPFFVREGASLALPAPELLQK